MQNKRKVKVPVIGHWLLLMSAPLLVDCSGSSGSAAVAVDTTASEASPPRETPKHMNGFRNRADWTSAASISRCGRSSLGNKVGCRSQYSWRRSIGSTAAK